MLNTNNLTQKSMEAISTAQSIAVSYQNMNIEQRDIFFLHCFRLRTDLFLNIKKMVRRFTAYKAYRAERRRNSEGNGQRQRSRKGVCISRC